MLESAVVMFVPNAASAPPMTTMTIPATTAYSSALTALVPRT